MKKQTNKGHHPRFFIKGVFILLLLGMNYLLFSYLFSSMVEDITYDNESYRAAHLLELTGEGDYSELYDMLNLYDLYGDGYEDYWDVTEAWHLYCRCRAATQAADRLASDPAVDAQADAADYAAQADELLVRLMEFPADQENRTAQEAVREIILSVDIL